MHSLYVHIPFCRRACHYCDFHFSTTLKRRDDVVKAICKELILRKKEAEKPIKAIYIGGGTPSVLIEEHLKELFEVIYENYPVDESAEITMEINPDDFVGENKHLEMKFLKELTINRVSIGVQSFFDDDLALINRTHKAKQAKEVVEMAMETFENVTIDLIYAIPTLDDNKWQKNIETALCLKVPHISAYSLTVEKKTPLFSLIEKGKIPNISDEKAERQFFTLKDRLEREGFVHYELSNFAKEGFFSKNNTAYWEGEKYMGVGPSAHSYDGKSRSWNISNNIKYAKALIENGTREVEIEKLSEKEKYEEIIMTGIRTKKGIDLKKIGAMGKGFYMHTEKVFKKLEKKGLVTEVDGKIVVTRKGLFLMDGISVEFFL